MKGGLGYLPLSLKREWLTDHVQAGARDCRRETRSQWTDAKVPIKATAKERKPVNNHPGSLFILWLSKEKLRTGLSYCHLDADEKLVWRQNFDALTEDQLDSLRTERELNKLSKQAPQDDDPVDAAHEHEELTNLRSECAWGLGSKDGWPITNNQFLDAAYGLLEEMQRPESRHQPCTSNLFSQGGIAGLAHHVRKHKSDTLLIKDRNRIPPGPLSLDSHCNASHFGLCITKDVHCYDKVCMWAYCFHRYLSYRGPTGSYVPVGTFFSFHGQSSNTT